jgi:hypothetical protein
MNIILIYSDTDLSWSPVTDLTTHSCLSVFQLFVLDADYKCEECTTKPKVDCSYYG